MCDGIGREGGVEVAVSAPPLPPERQAPVRVLADPGVERWREHLGAAWRAARAGRHARAVRMCQAARAALGRRGARQDELAALLLLVRLHLERGDPARALRACGDAEACAAPDAIGGAQVVCQLWRAWALIDAGDAAQAVQHAEAACSAWRDGWCGRVARGVRTCARQGAGLDGADGDALGRAPWTGHPSRDEWPLAVRAWAARVEWLVRAGHTFEAGREAAAFDATAAAWQDEEAGAEAALAGLRVAAASGQAAAVGEAAAVALRLASRAHLPFVRLRALAVWRDFAIASGAPAGALRMRVRRLAARAPRGWQQACGLEAAAACVQPARQRPSVDRAHAVRASRPGATEVPGLIGDTPVMVRLREEILRAARTTFPVLIEGETGSGKELVARGLHLLGPRAGAPFRDVNCAALADELIDAELFGHTRGAFTGAVAGRAGLIEEASGGTLFLDEVADLAPRAQAKLLRALQQQEVRRVGEGRVRPVDVRIVAACNRPLDAEVTAGRFRADLVYRVAGLRILVPPLRARAQDIPLLAEAFWRQLSAQAGTAAALTSDVVDRLMAYAWPGNVRELQHVLATLAVRAPAVGRVTVALLPPALAGRASHVVEPLAAARSRFERDYVGAALAQAGHSPSRAARTLGLSRQGLRKLLARTSGAGSA